MISVNILIRGTEDASLGGNRDSTDEELNLKSVYVYFSIHEWKEYCHMRTFVYRWASLYGLLPLVVSIHTIR